MILICIFQMELSGGDVDLTVLGGPHISSNSVPTFTSDGKEIIMGADLSS